MPVRWEFDKRCSPHNAQHGKGNGRAQIRARNDFRRRIAHAHPFHVRMRVYGNACGAAGRGTSQSRWKAQAECSVCLLILRAIVAAAGKLLVESVPSK